MRPSKKTAKPKENETVSVLRFRLEPTKEQERQLFHTFYLCRQLYNAALEERFAAYQVHGISVHYTEQKDQLPS